MFVFLLFFFCCITSITADKGPKRSYTKSSSSRSSPYRSSSSGRWDKNHPSSSSPGDEKPQGTQPSPRHKRKSSPPSSSSPSTTARSKPSYDPSVSSPCYFSDDTIAAIRTLFRTDSTIDEDKYFQEQAKKIILNCVTDTVTSLNNYATELVNQVGGTENAISIASGALGAAGGGYMGSTLGGELASTLLGEEYADAGTYAGAVLGTVIGGFAGAISGNEIVRIITAEDFIGNNNFYRSKDNQHSKNPSPPPAESTASSKQRTIQACRTLLDVSSSATAAEIRHAYKQQALTNHPDKGGTQEDMIYLNFCKEALLSLVL